MDDGCIYAAGYFRAERNQPGHIENSRARTTLAAPSLMNADLHVWPKTF